MTNLDSQKLLRKTLPILIFATLVCLPLYLIRCKNLAFCVSPIPFTLLEILILLTFFTWIVLRVSEVGFFKLFTHLRNQIPIFIQVLIGIFLLSALVNALFISQTASALGIFKAYFLEPFLIFIVIFDFLKITKNHRLIILALVICGLWVSLLSILNLIFQYNPANPAELIERGRVSAVYSTSNAVGLLVGPIALVFFGYILEFKYIGKNSKNQYKVLLIALLILLVGILVSGSRGTFLGIILAILFFFAYLAYFKLNLKVKKLLNASFITLIILVFTLIFLFFINIGSITKNSLDNKEKLPSNSFSRVCLWEGAVEIIKDQPLFGAGLSNFQKAHGENRTCSQEESIYPHNIILNFWTETGLFGLISFMGLSIYTFVKLLSQRELNYLALGVAAAFVEIFIHGLVDVPYFKNDLSVLFWTILALGLWVTSLPQGQQSLQRSRKV